MNFGSHRVSITTTKPDGTKYHTEIELTEEFMMGAEDAHQTLADETTFKLAHILDKTYDEYDFDVGDITSSESIPRDKIWRKIKNINTDEELEEIRKFLRIKDE